MMDDLAWNQTRRAIERQVAIPNYLWKVVRALLSGTTDRVGLAEQLYLAPASVDEYLKRLYKTLSVGSRLDAIRKLEELAADQRSLKDVRNESAAKQNIAFWLDRPASLGGGFLGREREMAALERALPTHRTLVISGGLGTGKSRLAAEYAHTSGTRGFWSHAGTTADETLAALALPLGIYTRDWGQASLAREVAVALAQLQDDVLWVIDNVTDLDLVNALMMSAGSARLLITSRDARRHLIPPSVAFLRLEPLEADEALRLLCSRSDADRHDPTLMEIVESVGFLPIALEILAVRLGEPLQKPERIRTELRDAPTPIELEVFEQTAGSSIPKAQGVFAAIAGTLARLPKETRGRLAPFGYLADAPIPVELVSVIVDENEQWLRRMLLHCSRESVLDVRESAIVMHALTKAVIAATNDEPAPTETIRNVGLRGALLADEQPSSLRPELVHYERLYAHATTMRGTEDADILTLANAVGLGYRWALRHEEAIDLFTSTLRARERVLGRDHPDTCASRMELAVSLKDTGRGEDALPLIGQALAARERTLGRNHPDTLASRHELAVAYLSQGRLDDALRLDRRTLAARKRLFGVEHPSTLASRSNLALDLWAVGRRKEAVTHFEATLPEWERLFGTESLRTAAALNNLGEAYRMIDRTDAAIRLHQRALAIRDSALGNQYAISRESRNNLALCLQDVGRNDDSIRLLEEIIAERNALLAEQERGSERRIDVRRRLAMNRNNLAVAYMAADRSFEAVDLFQETLVEMKELYGVQDRRTMLALNNLATAYADLGLAEAPLPLYEEALSGIIQLLGAKHPNTVTVRRNLVRAYRDAGYDDRARSLERPSTGTPRQRRK